MHFRRIYNRASKTGAVLPWGVDRLEQRLFLSGTPTSPGWLVTEATSSDGLGSIAQAQAVLAGQDIASDTSVIEPYLDLFNHQDSTGEGDGLFKNDLPFPDDANGVNNYFAIQATGLLEITQAGSYTFGTNSDDGSILEINNGAGLQTVVDSGNPHPPLTKTGTINFASPGRYPIEVIYYQQARNASLEAFAEMNTSSGSPSFELIGDTAHGGLGIIESGAPSAGADKLIFTQQPSHATVGTKLGVFAVSVESSGGTLLTGDSSRVTLALSGGPDSAVLSGTTTVNAVNGVATFSDLSITPVGSDYTLTATDGTDTPATSGGVNIFTPPETIGDLDLGFGTRGLAGHNVGFSSTQGVAQDGTQSVIIGTIGTSPNEAFGITRYNGDGTLDSAFGNDGVTKTIFTSTDDVPSAVDVLPGGQILVAGTAITHAHGAVSGSEFAVAEYNADGSLDTSFGSGTGEVLISFSAAAGTLSNDLLQAMAVGSGGAIYLGGSSDASGKGNTDFAIAALNADGSVDAGFGTKGQSLLDFSGGDDSAHGLALQSNGDLVAAGSAVVSGVTEIALTRFLPNGTLDKHFGSAGLVTTNVRGVYDSASSVVIQPKGQIVIGGSSATGTGSSLSTDFVLARYTSTGRVDRSFGGGVITTSFGQPSAITQLLLESNGDIIASGKTTSSLTNVVTSELDVAVARYTTQGTLDTTFDTTGKTIVDLSVGVVATPNTQIAPLDTTDLGTNFDGFIASEQGPASMTPGGEILDAGNLDANTVEAELIAAGVDLVANVLSTLPSSVLGGLKGTASVSIKESGTTQAIGTVTISIQFAIDADDDGAVTAKTIAERISLKQGQNHSYKISFVYPSGLPDAGYYLVATLTESASLTDLNPDNNFAPSSSPVTIAPPTIALAGSSLSATTPFTAAKSAGVMFDLTNNGNVIAKGKTTVVLFLSPDQIPADGTQIINQTLSIGLSAGKAHVYTARFILPSILTAGSFYLLAIIDPSDSLGSIDNSDSVVIDPTILTVN